MSEYIERETAIDEIQRFTGYLDEDMILRLGIALKRIPAADVRPVVHGKWIDDGLAQKCSACGYAHYIDYIFKFCPNCGASMRNQEGNIPCAIKEIQAENVKRVILGEWKKDPESDIVICSNCGEEHRLVDYRASFCEDCGADMRAANQKWYEEQDALERLDMSDDED